jgi:hypothetical protein
MIPPSTFVRSKIVVEDIMKTVPEHGKAEESDFEDWGRKYGAAMVSVTVQIARKV